MLIIKNTILIANNLLEIIKNKHYLIMIVFLNEKDIHA